MSTVTKPILLDETGQSMLTELRRITGIASSVTVTVNGTTYTQVGGNIDIGTVITEHQSLAAYRTSAAQDAIDGGKADKPLVKTTMDSVATVNTQYYLGTQSAVSITLPPTDSLGQQIVVVFYSGATATSLSVAGCLGDIPTPTANNRYELNFEWDGSNWSLLSVEQAIPVEVV